MQPGPNWANVKSIPVGCWRTARSRARNAKINAQTMKCIAMNGRWRMNVRRIRSIWTSIVPDHAENAKSEEPTVRMTTNIAPLGATRDIARKAITSITWNSVVKNLVDSARKNHPMITIAKTKQNFCFSLSLPLIVIKHAINSIKPFSLVLSLSTFSLPQLHLIDKQNHQLIVGGCVSSNQNFAVNKNCQFFNNSEFEF